MDNFANMDMSLDGILGMENEYELLSKSAKVSNSKRVIK